MRIELAPPVEIAGGRASDPIYVEFDISVKPNLVRGFYYPLKEKSAGTGVKGVWWVLTSRVPLFFYLGRPNVEMLLQNGYPEKAELPIPIEVEKCGDEKDNDKPAATTLLDMGDGEEEGAGTGVSGRKNIFSRAWGGIKSTGKAVVNAVTCVKLRTVTLPAKPTLSLFLNEEDMGIKSTSGPMEFSVKVVGLIPMTLKFHSFIWNFQKGELKVDGAGALSSILSKFVGWYGKRVIGRIFPAKMLSAGYVPHDDPDLFNSLAIVKAKLAKPPAETSDVSDRAFVDQMGRDGKFAMDGATLSRIETPSADVADTRSQLSTIFKTIIERADSTVKFKVVTIPIRDRPMCMAYRGKVITLAKDTPISASVGLLIPKRAPGAAEGSGPLEAINSLLITKVEISFAGRGLQMPGTFVVHRGVSSPDEVVPIRKWSLYPAKGPTQFEQGRIVVEEVGKPAFDIPESPVSLGTLWRIIASLRNPARASDLTEFAAPIDPDGAEKSDCGGLLGSIISAVEHGFGDIRAEKVNGAARAAALAVSSQLGARGLATGPGVRVSAAANAGDIQDYDFPYSDKCASAQGHLFSKLVADVYQNVHLRWTGYAGCMNSRPSSRSMVRAIRAFAENTDIDAAVNFPASGFAKCGKRELLYDTIMGGFARVVPIASAINEKGTFDVQSYLFEVYVPGEPNRIAYVIRGSDSSRDWCVNLSLQKTIVERDLGGSALPGKVHQGIWDHWGAVRSDVIPIVKRYVDAGYKLAVAGHSLGGAAATLAAFDLSRKLWGDLEKVPTSKLEVHLYGAPRVGDLTFVQAFDKFIGASTMNYQNHFLACMAGMPIHGQDVVTAIPPSSFGFISIGELPGSAAKLCKMRCPLSLAANSCLNQNAPYAHSLKWCHGPREYADSFILAMAQQSPKSARPSFITKWNERKEECKAPQSLERVPTKCQGKFGEQKPSVQKRARA